MAKVFVIFVALLATAIAEPPVESSYLPPNGRETPASQYGVPNSAGGLENSNAFGSSPSSLYQQPLNNLDSDSLGQKNNFDYNGHQGQLSNTYGPPSSDQSLPNFDSDSVSVDAVARSRGSFSSQQPSSTYGAPKAFGQSHSRSSFRNSLQALSSTYGAPSDASSYSRASNLPQNSYGAPFRSSQSFSPFRSSSQPPNSYGAPRSNNAGFRGSSGYSAPRAQPVNKHTTAIQSNARGLPFNSASDNTFPASPSFYTPPSNGYNYRPRGLVNQGYARQAMDENSLSEPARYEYNYEVQADDESGTEFGHREARENESAKGVYHVLLPDGRMQIVEYEADESGYRPNIRYEETGYPGARSGFNGY